MPKIVTPRRYTCAQARCGKKVSFATPDELDSHLRIKHRSKMYKCTALGCVGKRGTARKFQHSHQLTTHIKDSHCPETNFMCPAEDCSFGPEDLDNVAAHVYWSHTLRPERTSGRLRYVSTLATKSWNLDAQDSVQGFVSAATWRMARCLISDRCKPFTNSHLALIDHLAVHSPKEICCAKDKLLANGYEVQLNPNDQVQGKFSIKIICPACKFPYEDKASFQRHVQEDHLLINLPGVWDHFEVWKSCIWSWTRSQEEKRGLMSSRKYCWHEHTMVESERLRSSITWQCPKCKFVLVDNDYGRTPQQHPSFLRPMEEVASELLQHRFAIARHFPDFLTHPIFQDYVYRNTHAGESRHESSRVKGC